MLKIPHTQTDAKDDEFNLIQKMLKIPHTQTDAKDD
jgi:hypothetical protein